MSAHSKARAVWLRLSLVPGRADRVSAVLAITAPPAAAAALVPLRSHVTNTALALVMVAVVVLVVTPGRRLAALAAGISAGVWFDFFLTRPYERFTITRRTDIETAVLLLVIGVAVTEIAVWGRRHYAIASRRAGYLDGINNAARAVAAGGSAPALIDQVSGQLVRLLSLRSCVFQYGVAGLGRPARLHRDGSVTLGQLRWAVDGEVFPPGTDVELLVEGGGIFQGRFLMTPAPGARPALERRLLAVAFADQVGAALASSHPVGHS
jgi:K+-sensing histidine kinase KdpD